MPANPVKLGRQWFDVPRRTRHIKADDLPTFYAAAVALPNPVQRDYVLFLLFTGLRRREAAGLRWDPDVDLAGRVIRVPGASTKTGEKLDLPMSTFVRDLLVARRAIGAGVFVFPADSESGHIEEPKYPLGMIAATTGIRSRRTTCGGPSSRWQRVRTSRRSRSRRSSTTASATT